MNEEVHSIVVTTVTSVTLTKSAILIVILFTIFGSRRYLVTVVTGGAGQVHTIRVSVEPAPHFTTSPPFNMKKSSLRMLPLLVLVTAARSDGDMRSVASFSASTMTRRSSEV
jgi:hypothetical protein